VAADAFEQFALAALFALLPGWYAGFVGKHLVPGLVEVNDEFFPELFDGFAPRQLAFFDFVEFLFEPRVNVTSKMSSKLFTSSTLTRSPSMVGEKRPWFLVTYSRSTMVEIIEA